MTAKATKKSPEKQPYHHGDLRAALISAALELIDEHGVKAFTLKDAARLAGVSVAAPYRHFADKDALIQAIKEEGFSGFDAALRASGQDGQTAQGRILELGVAYVRFALEHPAHFRVMFSLAGGAQAKPPSKMPAGFSLLVDSVARLHPHASAAAQKDLVLACWSAVHGYAVLYLEGAFAATVQLDEPEAQLRRTLLRLM